VSRATTLQDDTTTRSRILEAAQRLFAQNGFDATTTKAIAEHAGVPSGLIFYHYGNKAGLLKAMLNNLTFLPRLLQRFDALEDSLSPRAFLLATLRLFCEEFSTNLEGMRIIMGEMQRHPEVLTTIRQLRESFSAHVAARLNQKIDGTPWEGLHTQLAVKMLFSNVMFLRLVDQEPELDRHLEGMVDIVLGDTK